MPKKQLRTYTVSVGDLPVSVTEKRMKSLRLRVLAGGEIRFSVPIGTPRAHVMRFLLEREPWIRRAREQQLGRARRGDVLTLWGTPYTLTVTECGRRYLLTRSEADRTACLTVPIGSTEAGRARYLDSVLKEELARYLSVALPRAETLTGLRASSYDLRRMKSRWGSCNVRTGHLCLNLRLAEYPQICTDYVVLHELCHLRHADHGAAFKSLLSSYLPEWKDIRRLLNG